MLDGVQLEKVNKQLQTLHALLQGLNKSVKTVGESLGKAPKQQGLNEKLAEARKATEKSTAQAEKQFEASEGAADAGLGRNNRKRNQAKTKNELKLHADLAAAYTAELNAILAGGDEAVEEHKKRYEELIALLGEEQNAAVNMGKGKNADGTQKGFWRQLTEMSDKDVESLKNQAWDLASKLSDAVFSTKQQESKRKLKVEKKAIDEEYKAEVKTLDAKRSKGLISEKKYQAELEKLNEKKAKKVEAAERAAFEREKQLNIKQAIMNTAIGIAKAFAQYGPIIGIPFAAMAAAQGAIQIASISAQKYALGGLIPLGGGVGVVRGRSHAQGGHRLYLDGVPIGEVEGDELLAVVNKHDTARIGALSAANSVHGRRFADGGLTGPGGYRSSDVWAPVRFGSLEALHQTELSRQQQARQSAVIEAIREDTRQQVAAVNSRIDTLKVVVLAQDVTDVQGNIKKIKVKSSW